MCIHTERMAGHTSRHLIRGCLVLSLSWSIAAGDPLSDCRNISAEAARLSCYDALADRQAQLTVATSTTAAASAAQTTPPSLTAEELFGRDAAQSDDLVRRASDIGRLDEITAEVAGARVSPNGKLIVALDNGQVWSQVDSPAPRIRPGDKVRIRRAALNSYLLVPAEGGKAIRVHRDQ
jgi:hypothetical protein